MGQDFWVLPFLYACVSIKIEIEQMFEERDWKREFLRYENSAVEFDLKWYVSDDAAEELRDAKTGNVKWIFYSFFIGGALMLILFFFGRKYMNPEVFMTPEERGVDNGLDGVGNETVMPKEKKKKKK